MLAELRTTCTTCNDTHRMSLGDRDVSCTRCPLPCDVCRSHVSGAGPGAYCATTPCPCSCHASKRGSMQIQSALTHTIATAIGRPVTDIEAAVLHSMYDLTPTHAALAADLAKLDIGLCGEYLTTVVLKWEPYEYANYLNRLTELANRERALSIDASEFRLAPMQRILDALSGDAAARAAIAAHVDLSAPEAYAVQNAIVHTIRGQLEHAAGSPGQALLLLMGQEAFEQLLLKISGNIVQILL